MQLATDRRIAITGIRGIPAAHGGFETYAQELSLYLVGRGWEVTVYNQTEGWSFPKRRQWKGVNLVELSCPPVIKGAFSTIVFDLLTVMHTLFGTRLILVLGYNTAIFNIVQWLCGKTIVFNMDGFEWKRAKWGRLARIWLRLNDWVATKIGSKLVADHPEVFNYYETKVTSDKLIMLPYGAHLLSRTGLPQDLLALRLKLDNYFVVIARPEPENSILDIVSAFREVKTEFKLVILGSFDPGNSYHRQVKEAADKRVLFLGAIYDKGKVAALRSNARAYVHGHTVGGTNPSLVEALGSGSAVIAHDNCFNRWVASDSAIYFSDREQCRLAFQQLADGRKSLDALRSAAKKQYYARFQWSVVLEQNEQLFRGVMP